MDDPGDYIDRLREVRQREAELALERSQLRKAADAEILRSFGARVREARTVAGLTQEQLAAAVDMSRASIANIEAGRQDVPITTGVILATALGLPTSALLDH